MKQDTAFIVVQTVQVVGYLECRWPRFVKTAVAHELFVGIYGVRSYVQLIAVKWRHKPLHQKVGLSASIRRRH